MITGKRNLELLYTERDFSRVLIEVKDPILEQCFDIGIKRQNIQGLPFKDCRSLICRQSSEVEVPSGLTEIEMLRYSAEHGVNGTAATDTPAYELVPEVYAEVMKLAAGCRAEQIGRVAVTKLLPGGHILPHRDYGKYFEYYDRIHLVIGGEGCLFRCGAETAKMLPGEVWAFNSKEIHEVWNTSLVDRYHVIVDLKLRGDLHTRWPIVADYTNNLQFDVSDDLLGR